MKNSLKLALKLSEKRQEAATLAGNPEATPEQRAALAAEVAALEQSWREAVETEQRAEDVGGEGTGEGAELRALRGRVRMANYLTAAVEQRAADGAEAEYNAARNIAGNRFPLEMLAPREERATTDTDTATIPRRWIDRLFAGTAAAYLGVTFDTVAPGAASYPVTTAGASAAQRGRSEAAADGAWTIGVTELKPTRNAVRVVFNVEDAARIPGLEEALTRDLRAALTEGVDRAIFLGDAGANENSADITGLQTAAGLTEKTIAQADKVKGAETVQAFAELIDGKHAMQPSDLRTVMAVGANTLWSHSFVKNNNAVDTTIAEFLRRFGMSWVTRGDLEVATADGDFGAFIGLGRGIEGAGVAPVWEAGELIRDPYSGAAKGEVALTLCYLWDFGLARASNFARVKFVA